MSRSSRREREAIPRIAQEKTLGLFRQELLGGVRARTVCNLFSDLRRVNRGEFFGEDPTRHSQGSRVVIDREEGHGTWELYKLDRDLYIVASDGFYDSSRVEEVPGEGLVEFHLRLSGPLEMTLPGHLEPVIATGPRLLVMYQPPGVSIRERVTPRVRDSAVSLYCRPEYLEELVRRNSIERWPLLEDIQAHRDPASVWFRLLPLWPDLIYVARSLLQNPYRRGMRLMHAEAKALELLCEVLSSSDAGCADQSTAISDGEVRRLEVARTMLSSRISDPPRIGDIARTIGMSESKLKRSFKERYGVTVFDFGVERRMRHALYLLRAQRLSVDQVAHAVGYRHQTSFSAAFRAHFGFLPRNARNEVH